MSSVAARIPFITAEEYLEGEKLAAVKHEYVDGQVYAMSGASDRHNQISLDIAANLKQYLRGGPYRTYLLDLKVQVKTAKTERFYYPDVFVTCDPGDTDSHVKRHPKLVIEVLSESVGYEAPLASFYESAPFPPDVKRPWYLTDRPEG